MLPNILTFYDNNVNWQVHRIYEIQNTIKFELDIWVITTL